MDKILYFDFQPPVFFIIISYHLTECPTIFLSTPFLASETTPPHKNLSPTSKTKSNLKSSKETPYSPQRWSKSSMLFRESKPFYMKIWQKKHGKHSRRMAIKRKEGLPLVHTGLFSPALQETFRNRNNFKTQNDR